MCDNCRLATTYFASTATAKMPAPRADQVYVAMKLLPLMVTMACDRAASNLPHATFSMCRQVNNWVECEIGDVTLRCGFRERLSGKTYRHCSNTEPMIVNPKPGWDLPSVGCARESQTAVLLSDESGGQLLTARADVQRTFPPQSTDEAMELLKLVVEVGVDYRNKIFAPSGAGPFKAQIFQRARCGCGRSTDLVYLEIDRNGTVRETGRQPSGDRIAHSCVD